MVAEPLDKSRGRRRVIGQRRDRQPASGRGEPEEKGRQAGGRALVLGGRAAGGRWRRWITAVVLVLAYSVDLHLVIIGCLDDFGGGGDESPAAGATAAGPGPAGECTAAGETAGGMETEVLRALQSLPDALAKLGKKERGGLVDQRGLGKPYTLGEDAEEKFRVWASKLEDYVTGVFSGKSREVLEWAAGSEGNIVAEEIDKAYGRRLRTTSASTRPSPGSPAAAEGFDFFFVSALLTLGKSRITCPEYGVNALFGSR